MHVNVFQRTGKYRKPLKDEWYIGPNGQPVQAHFPIFGKREILKRVGVDPVTLMHKGDPYIYCKTGHDDIEIGFCSGRIKNGILVEAENNG